MIRIIIADDHSLFRNGIKALLTPDENFTIVGEAADIPELLTLLQEIPADVLLLDISLPSGSGLELLEFVKIEFPSLKCILLTMHEERQYVMQSLKKGADGYLLKEADDTELKEAIRQVYAGKKYFKNKISDLIIESVASPTLVTGLLTEKEIEIVRMVAEGKITKEIADLLCVSVRTVESYRSRIMKKMNVANTAEMVRLAYKHKII
jgi:two-component system, NarL family, response regulator NreC